MQMQMGYNNDVGYRGKTIHVQTEDHGIKSKKITTQVFIGGAILESMTMSYAEDIEGFEEGSERDDVIRRRMKGQHKKAYIHIKQGKHDEKLGLPPKPASKSKAAADKSSEVSAETTAADDDAAATDAAPVAAKTADAAPKDTAAKDTAAKDTAAKDAAAKDAGAKDAVAKPKTPAAVDDAADDSPAPSAKASSAKSTSSASTSRSSSRIRKPAAVSRPSGATARASQAVVDESLIDSLPYSQMAAFQGIEPYDTDDLVAAIQTAVA